jgi:potassium voltage-gated channel Eag-related subfamily H protein 8
LGDLNSRTAEIKETLYTNMADEYSDQGIGNADNQLIESNFRHNCDKGTNSSGRALITILNDAHLLIMNGRLPGDLSGQLTYHGPQGSSSIDLAIGGPELIQKVVYFRVLEPIGLSDHCPITLSMKINRLPDHWHVPQNTRQFSKFVWTSDSDAIFRENIASVEVQNKLAAFCTTNFDNVSLAAKNLTSLLQEVGHKSLKVVKISKRHRKSHRPDMEPEIQAAKRVFKQAKREFMYNVHAIDRRITFIRERRKYKQTIYRVQRHTKEKNLQKLSALEKKDPKAFWKAVNDLIKPNRQSDTNIDSSEWVMHFSKLLNPTNKQFDPAFYDYVTSSTPIIESEAPQRGPLDGDIKETEVFTAIHKLRRGKSSGVDMISNEMLKCAGDMLRKPITHLFNTILKHGVYPKEWATNIIVPIHKGDSTDDPNNYRGIAISSCLSKSFNSILNTRLEKFMQSNNLWRKNQSGFMKKHRTEDNLFIYQTILHKYVKENKQKVYVAFVDFKKYFDTINRQLLYYKLLKLNVVGKFYQIIKSMYSMTEYCVKTPSGLTEPFESYRGVKQGCNLSPTLANIFQNDLHDIFGNECDPVSLDDLMFNSLSWADDLLLFSTTPEGLQQCLNRLKDYCYKWGLEVNTKKTKCMTLRNTLSTKVTDKFNYDGKQLDNVDKFTYLGIDLSATGNMANAIKGRILKASRAASMCRQAQFTTGNVDVRLALSIFEKQILPILSYGCPIWGMPNFTNTIYLDELPDNVQATAHARELVRNVCQSNVKIDLARKVKAPMDTNGQSVLMKFQNYLDKECFIHDCGEYRDNIVSRDADWECDKIEYQKVHNSFCKFVLNVSKYASTEACRGELGQYPICNKIWTLGVKYWLRLEHGTPNLFVNKAYKCAKEGSHPWVQNIKCLLSRNGFGYVWDSPDVASVDNFGKMFQVCLNDQYVQTWERKINTSNRLTQLAMVKPDFGLSPYLTGITNIDAQNTLTRLRIDMNKLMVCQGRQKGIA